MDASDGRVGDAGAARSLDAVVEAQRIGCESAGSPLYATVLAAVAAELAAGSEAGATCRRVFEPCTGASYGDAVVLRFLAGVHQLVLTGRAPDLAGHYPSVGGVPGAGLVEDFLAAVAVHEVELRAAMERPVQTNEVGRSVALLVGFLDLGRSGRPLRVLEVGASAGLNLWFDRYRYEAGGEGWGPNDSALRFTDAYQGRTPMGRWPEVVERRGCDLAPIDPTTDEGRLRLRSLVWPDQVARRQRLDDAIAMVSDLPTAVDRGDALDWCEEQLGRRAPGVVTVLTHSIVLQYLPTERRRRFVQGVEAAGRRATPDAPLAWLRMEPAGERAEVRLTTWPDGATTVVAVSGFHGPPVTVVGSG